MSAGDPATVVQLTAQMGLPTLEVELVDGDGFMSPARARRLAMLLTEAATRAEECLLSPQQELEVVS